MNITVVCKGGVNTGLGHLHRTISFVKVAEQYVRLSIIAILEEGLEKLFDDISDTTLIYSEEDLERAIRGINHKGKKCIIDCVDLSNYNQGILRSRFDKIISLSPVFNNYAIIDVLFTRFQQYEYPPHIKVFSGYEYSILNKNCRVISDYEYLKSLEEEHLTIAISMGGVDAPNKTLRVLQAISKIDIDLTIWVLLGEGYSHSYQSLVDSIAKDTNHEIVLAKTNRSMWKILSNCSLAILAGGLTSFEAIYAGLPTINIFEKEVHRDIMSEEFNGRKVSLNLGLMTDATLRDLKKILVELDQNRSKLERMRQNMKGLLDQKGAERTIKTILNL